MKKTLLILAGGALFATGVIVSDDLIHEALAATHEIGAEAEAELDVAVADTGKTKVEILEAAAMDAGEAARQRFDVRAVRAVRHMRDNPDTGFGPLNAKWAQVRSTLLAAEAAMQSEQEEPE